MPRTTLGKWSLGLIVAMPILLFVGTTSMNLLYSSVPAGNSILEDISGRPMLALAMLAGMASGISAFVTGLTSIWKHGERAAIVYVSTGLGLFLLLFLLGELLLPY